MRLRSSCWAAPSPPARERLSATPSPRVEAVSPLAPAVVLARYDAALRAHRVPPYATFEYSVQQAGPRNIDQWRRVYRAQGAERNETLAVNGVTYKHPSVRILRGGRDRYAIGRIAPRAAQNVFTFVRAQRIGSHDDYVFDVRPRAGRAFHATRMIVDGIRFLPTTVDFETRSPGGSTGHGELRYALAQGYWMIQEAFVASRYAGDRAQERIVWMHYRFPARLPATTFTAPRILPEPPVLSSPARPPL